MEYMAMITINGTSLPDPSSLKMSKMDISTAKSGRDELGTMHKMIVARKRKYEITWAQMTPAQAYQIQAICESGSELQCTIFDPSAGTTATGTYTCGDRESDWQQWIDPNLRNYDNQLFKTISVHLIEV